MNAASSASETPPPSARFVEPPALLLDLEDRVHAEHQPDGDQDRAEDVGALTEADPVAVVDFSRTANSAVAIPIGTLMMKIQCQLIASVSAPPASRPIELPDTATNVYILIAFACSLGSGNIITIIPRITARSARRRCPEGTGP